MFKESLENVRNFEEICTEFVDVNKSLPDYVVLENKVNDKAVLE